MARFRSGCNHGASRRWERRRTMRQIVETLLPTTLVGSYPRPTWFQYQLLGRDIRVAFKQVAHAEAFADATRVVAYLLVADKYSRPLASRLIGVGQPVIGTQNAFAALHPTQLADI